MEKVHKTCLGHLFSQSKYRICMELLPEAYLRSRDRPLYFGDDLDYDPDLGGGLLSGSLDEVDQFCKIYNNFISKYIGAYLFSMVIIDGI